MSTIPYLENISIDITPDTIKLAYTKYTGVPQPKPLKSGFVVKRPDDADIQEFKEAVLVKIQEVLPKLFDGTFEEYIKDNPL